MAKYLKVDADGVTVLEIVTLPDNLPAIEQAVTAEVDVPIGVAIDNTPITEKRDLPVLDGDGKQVVAELSPYNTREMSAENGKPFLLPVAKESIAAFDAAKQKLAAPQFTLRDADADIVVAAVDLSSDEKAAVARRQAEVLINGSASDLIGILGELVAGSVSQGSKDKLAALVAAKALIAAG